MDNETTTLTEAEINTENLMTRLRNMKDEFLRNCGPDVHEDRLNWYMGEELLDAGLRAIIMGQGNTLFGLYVAFLPNTAGIILR